MSLPDLYGTLYPDLSRFYQSQWFETRSFPIYKGDTFNGDLVVFNDGTEKAGAFDVDLYISTDPVVDTSDRYLGTYTFTDGIDGESSYSTLFPFLKDTVTITLPNSEDSFWQDRETYYLATIIDPENAVVESDESNNRSELSLFDRSYHGSPSASTPITVQQADLPVVSFTQHDNTLQINLSEPAPKGGFAVDYQNVTREDYFNGSLTRDPDNYQYGHRYFGSRFYDLEYDRFHITKESYHDLLDYKFYDGDGGHYDPVVDKYFNADGSYYDVAEKLFYDAEDNVTELTDNSAEYTNSSSSPRHYLPTGGYISLVSGIYYDASGGYIDEATEEYFRVEGEDGLGRFAVDVKFLQNRAAGLELGFGILSPIATPDLDYEIVPGDNVENITESTITVAPGETTATIDFNFFSDLVFDPNETIEFELLEKEEYLLGRSSLFRYSAPKPDMEDLENPGLGDFNFSVDRNARPGTTLGHVNFSDPQGDELIYSLVEGGNELYDLIDGERYLKPQYRHTDIDLDLELIETSNQDLDGDGIHPFSIDATTGAISLNDFDDLDREAINNVAPEDYSQLYNSGYYQLFVRVADEVPTEDDLRYSTFDLYETSIVNVRVVDLPTTPGDDNVVGTLDNDIIRGKGGDDIINGLAGNDTINGGADSDRLLGSIGDDLLIGSVGNDTLNGGMDRDRLFGSAGRDLLIGSMGDDTLNGGIGYDTLNGGSGEDVLIGLYGDDTLNGGEGNDFLKGGKGIDRLVGNRGQDIFALEIDSGKDLIVDFEDGIDSIAIPIGLSFADLNILDASVGSATMILNRNSDETIAVLKGIDADTISETDFV